MSWNGAYEDEESAEAEPAPPPPISQAWVVSFSDLMALMLAFFVMIFSMSELQTQAWRSIVTGLSDSLSPGREMSVIQREENARPFRVLEPKGIDLGYLEAVIKEKFRNHPVLASARITSRPDRVVIALPVEMLFAPESAQPASAAPAVLATIAESLASVKNRIEIHVYSREATRPALSESGNYASAWELSLDRALTAKRLLSQSGGGLPVIPVGHMLANDGAAPAGDLVELIIRERDGK